jgi:glutamate racemase
MFEPKGAVGIFDSGVGGLTVLRQLADRLADESFIYLGDTARVPYGTKSAETVIRYAKACANLLYRRGIKLLVVACNTASAYALDVLRDDLTVPVVGVIEPGARNAAASSRNGRIGVVGTVGTIRSGVYEAAIRTLAPQAKVFCKACPLFVPLAEEGWTQGTVPRQVAREYLQELAIHGIDTLVLGCTHYPLLKPVIAEAMTDSVTLVDSAEAAAAVVGATIERMGLTTPRPSGPRHRFLVTDDPEAFCRIGKHFMGAGITDELANVEWVDIG